MKIAGSRILLTGATGGIGRALAPELARRGARLALAGRDTNRLARLAGEISNAAAPAVSLPSDLARPGSHAELVRCAHESLGGIDVLINNAGRSRFSAFAGEDEAALRDLIEVNVTAPLLLARAALPHLLQRGTGCIVNIGSVFGAIGFPYHAAYSATKFALRGFSEALRRELADSGVKVLYIAPRATATAMNGPAARALMADTGTAVDAPEKVAVAIADALAGDRQEVTLGGPERIFVRLNALLPGIVDASLVKQGRIAAHHLLESKAAK
ncbi:MAG: SDR family oxidoreductase [Betaproteobacteria bacterium]|nr:SDR family oxidoreductase [Betaproteobacteria bacterium]